jgi:chromosome segregation ATPase
MDTQTLLAISGSAVGGVLAGAAACYWPLSRLIIALRERLERSESARNGAVERSAQAREQIAQLNRAITELRRTHSTHSTHSTHDKLTSSREQLDKALDESEDKTLPRREAGQAFADTQLLSKL